MPLHQFVHAFACAVFLGLVLGFVCFCFPNFVLFWRDLWVILVLCILSCCSLICEFPDFLHFRDFLVLVGFVLSCQQV